MINKHNYLIRFITIEAPAVILTIAFSADSKESGTGLIVILLLLILHTILASTDDIIQSINKEK